MIEVDPSDREKKEIHLDFENYHILGTRNELIFFYIMDCDNNVSRSTPSGWKLYVTFDIPEKDGYLNLGEWYVYWFKILGMITLIVFFSFYYKPILREFSNEYSDTNYAFLIVTFGIIFRLVSIIIDLVELHVLSSYGEESPVIHFFAKAFEVLSGYLVLLTMLFIAHGWTITFSKIEDMELFLPLSIALGVLKLILVGMGRLVKLDQHHFHAFDGFVGMIMCFFNVTMLLYYFYQIYQLRDSIKNHKKVNKFYTVLSLVVIWYLGTFPVAYVTAYLLDDWKRAAVIELVNTVGQLVGSLALAWLLTAKGRYTDIADFNLGLPSSLKRQD